MRYRAAAVVLALAAAVAIGQVPMYSDYPWGLLNNGTDQGPVWNLNCVPPLWCTVPTYGNGQVQLGDGGVLPIAVAFASDAGQALLAGFADYAADAGLSNRAITSDFAADAGFSLQSGLAAYALDAGLAGRSFTADFASDAGFAIFAGDAGRAFISNFSDYAADAGYSQASGLAGVATYALDAGLANKAVAADFARDAGSAASADLATAALWAGDAGFSTTSALATYALDAGLAGKALAADFARDAGSAANADFARDAGSAASADVSTFALDAGRAVFAGFAADAGLAVAALYAGDAGNVVCPGCITTGKIATGGVSTSNISDLAVTAAKLDNGIAISAYDEATPAGIFSRSSGIDGATKQASYGGEGYIRYTVTGVGGGVISTGRVETGITIDTVDGTMSVAVFRYRFGGTWLTGTGATVTAVNSANALQTATFPVSADGAWHVAVADISSWTSGTFRLVVTGKPSAGAAYFDLSYVGTGNPGSGTGGLVSYQDAVGIGIATPSAKLDVSSAGYPASRIASTYASGGLTYTALQLGASDTNQAATLGYVYNPTTPTSSFAYITPYGSLEGEQFSVKANGNVGIGVSAPDFPLHVRKANTATLGWFENTSSSSSIFPSVNVLNYSAGGGFPTFSFYNARGTLASAAALNNGDSLGAHLFYGRASTAHVEGARIESTLTAAPGLSSLTAALRFYTANAGTSTERVRISANGYVGIGTTNPSQPLQVGNETGTQTIRIAGASSGTGAGSAVFFGAGASNIFAIGHYSNINGGAYNDRLNIYANAKDVVFTGLAKMGVNTATPAELLHVSGGNIRNSALAGVGNRAVYSDANGNLTNTSSDGTLKTVVEDLRAPLRMVLNLRPVSFNWKDTARFGPQREIGFLAQEVMQAIPEVVGRNADGTYTVDYPKIVAALAGAVQELFADRTALAQRVQALEDRAQRAEDKLAQLEARMAAMEAWSGVAGCPPDCEPKGQPRP